MSDSPFLIHGFLKLFVPSFLQLCPNKKTQRIKLNCRCCTFKCPNKKKIDVARLTAQSYVQYLSLQV